MYMAGLSLRGIGQSKARITNPRQRGIMEAKRLEFDGRIYTGNKYHFPKQR